MTLKHRFFSFLVLAIFIANTRFAYSQNQPSNKTDIAFLKQNGKLLLQQMQSNRVKAFAIAKGKGWKTSGIDKYGHSISLQRIDKFGLPIYFTTYNNSVAAATTNTNKLYNGGGLSLSLSGSTIPNGKVAIWDGGGVLTSHVEFANNRIETKDNSGATLTHSTHVAGTMVASGVYPQARGMAFGLPKLYAFDFNNDAAEMSSNAASLLISNHSYGPISGWQYNTDLTVPRWEFWGAPGATEDYKFGYYDSEASQWDKICYNAPYYLPVKSAGNSRVDNGPDVGLPYYRFDTNGTMSPAGNRPPGISSNDSFNTIATNANAKNILTVGAINPILFGAADASNIQIANFSSWGPTDDGRIKPDLVADGVNVTSTSDANVNAYTTISGTSMAAPNASGSLVLLQELYSQKNSGKYMWASTLKALAIATATDAGNTIGPDYVYGWGLLNIESAAKAILNNGTKSIITERTLNQNETQTVNVIASGDGPLIATICWTDPEATPIDETVALNDPTPRLVNDLDLRGNINSTTYFPWVLNPSSPNNPAAHADNFRDNVEQVYIADAVPGKAYTFSISHKANLQSGAQNYSLIITGIGGMFYCSSAPVSNADSRINSFKLSNINNIPTPSCTSYSDFTNQTIELEKGKIYPLELSLGTCGSNFDKTAKVFIDWNSDGDFNDEDELVATSPTINGDDVFSTNITLPPQANANNFTILRVVLQEVNNPSVILSCGNYAKGETQDYRVKILNPSVDVGVTEIVSPSSTSCNSDSQKVRVKIKNFGTVNISNIPISANVTENGNSVVNLSSTFAGTLAPLEEAVVELNNSFLTTIGKTYTISAKTNLVNDLNPTNDLESSTSQITISEVADAAKCSAYLCSSTNKYLLSTEIDIGTVFWYTGLTDLAPIGTGPNIITTQPPANNTFYIGINDYKGNVGPKNKSEFSDGGYNQFGPSVLINSTIPIVIESAKLYIGNSGKIIFRVINNFGAEVSSVTLDVIATRTSAGSGALPNDPNDPGQVYTLNLNIPKPGNYSIEAEYLNGATIFRNNSGDTNYPYFSDGNIFSITNNTASTSNNSYYYYFYDMKVKAIGCASNARTLVAISTPAITQTENTLYANFNGNMQWFYNGTLINGATQNTYIPKQKGNYTFEYTTDDGCKISSAMYTYTGTELSANDVNLITYPVPTNNDLNIKFDVIRKNDVKVGINNVLGQSIFTDEKLGFIGTYTNKTSLNKYPTGIYILHVKIGKSIYSRKVILVK